MSEIPSECDQMGYFVGFSHHRTRLGDSIMTVFQMPKNPCVFCHKHEATQLCDFVVDYLWTSAKDARGHMIGRTHQTCDNAICKECATEVATHEFCPTCYEQYQLIQHWRNVKVR